MTMQSRLANEPRMKLASLDEEGRTQVRRYYRTWRSVADRPKARYQALLFARELVGRHS